MKVVETVLDLIGNTPQQAKKDDRTKYICWLNSKPWRKYKGSVAQFMIEEERRGRLKPGMTIMEPASGNTGIGLALSVCKKVTGL